MLRGNNQHARIMYFIDAYVLLITDIHTSMVFIRSRALASVGLLLTNMAWLSKDKGMYLKELYYFLNGRNIIKAQQAK